MTDNRYASDVEPWRAGVVLRYREYSLEFHAYASVKFIAEISKFVMCSFPVELDSVSFSEFSAELDRFALTIEVMSALTRDLRVEDMRS
ncbi:MAG: hypothetical protein ABI548_13570 [Polyangiaceae bacterium]